MLKELIEMHSRIKEVRKKLGLSQAEFGSKLGLTQQSIALLEQGKTPVSDKHIKPICSIFSVNENWLRSGIGDMFVRDDINSRFNEIYNTLNEANRELIDNILDMMIIQQDNEDIHLSE